jgi:hypothetical protein
MTVGHWIDPLADGRDPVDKYEEPVRTKWWWRAQLNEALTPLPKPMTRRAYAQLKPEARVTNNRERQRLCSNLPAILTPQLLALDRRINLMLSADEDRRGVRQGLMLTGNSGSGKTTALLHLLQQFELGLMAAHPDYFDRRGDEYVPVAYVTTPSRPSVKALLIRIARFYDLPVEKAPDATRLEDAVLDMIRSCGSTVLVLDDLHNIDLGEASGRQTNKLLKALAEDSGANIIVVGMDLDHSRIFQVTGDSAINVQASSRFTPFFMKPFPVGTDDEIRQWAAVIWAMEEQFPLMDHRPGALAESQWEYLHARTGGSIGALGQLLRESAEAAIKDGIEQITPDILASIHIDLTNYQRTTTHLPKTQRGSR